MRNIATNSFEIMPDGVTPAEVPYANGNVGTNTPIGNMAWLNGQAADTKLPVNYWNWMLKQITKICLNTKKYFGNVHTEIKNLILNSGPGVLYPTNINTLADNNDNQMIEAINGKITSMRKSCIAGTLVDGTTLGTVTTSAASGKVSVNQGTGEMTANGLGDIAAAFTTLPSNVQSALSSDKSAAGLMKVIFSMVYPVGSIYTTATMSTAAQVQAAFGGTWAAYGQGRVLVGAGSSTDPNGTTRSFAAGDTNGYYSVKLIAANLAAHYHDRGAQEITGNFTARGLTDGSPGIKADGAFFSQSNIFSMGKVDTTMDDDNPPGTFGFAASRSWSGRSGGGHTAQSGGSAISGSAHENTQPYVVVYMYRRTA